MENLVSYIPAALIVISAVFAILYGIDEKLAKHIAIRTVAFVAAVVAIALILSLHGVARAEWGEAIIIDSQPTVYKGEECFLISVDIDGEIKEYFDSEDLPKESTILVDYVDGEILNRKEEPETIWLPPVLLLGAVTPIVKKNKKGIVRIQKMPVEREKGRTKQDFRLPVDLESKQTIFVYYEGLLRKFVAVDTVEKGLQLIKRATDKNYPAYLTAFVPAYNQQAVVATNWLGDLEYWFKTSIYFRVEEAYNLLCAKDVKTVLKVKYSQNGKKLYNFYPLGDIEIGKFVNVEKIDSFGKKTYKNVQVVDICKMTKETIEDLERRENMKIATIHCKYAIDLPECWTDWGGSDPRNIGVLKRIPASGVLTEEEMQKAQENINKMKLRQF